MFCIDKLYKPQYFENAPSPLNFKAKTREFESAESQVKLLMILAKYWFKSEVQRKFHSAKFPSYAIELICFAVAKNQTEETEEMPLVDLFMKFLYVGAIRVMHNVNVCVFV